MMTRVWRWCWLIGAVLALLACEAAVSVTTYPAVANAVRASAVSSSEPPEVKTTGKCKLGWWHGEVRNRRTVWTRLDKPQPGVLEIEEGQFLHGVWAVRQGSCHGQTLRVRRADVPAGISLEGATRRGNWWIGAGSLRFWGSSKENNRAGDPEIRVALYGGSRTREIGQIEITDDDPATVVAVHPVLRRYPRFVAGTQYEVGDEVFFHTSHYRAVARTQQQPSALSSSWESFTPDATDVDVGLGRPHASQYHVGVHMEGAARLSTTSDVRLDDPGISQLSYSGGGERVWIRVEPSASYRTVRLGLTCGEGAGAVRVTFSPDSAAVSIWESPIRVCHP